MGFEAAQTLNGDLSTWSYSAWQCFGSHCHAVQFYRDHSALLEQLGQLVGPAIAAGNSVLLIATKSHRESLFAHLRSCGTDFVLAVAGDRLILRDADETLAKFMVNGQPDPALFARVLSGYLDRLTASGDGPSPRLFVFEEMVPSLWADGKRDAAIRLEQLWNDLAGKYSFQLLCAYPMGLFPLQRDRDMMRKICEQHSHVLPHVLPAAHASPDSHDDHSLDSVALLQRKARALEIEIRERKRVHRALQQREAELSDFFENAPIGMHWLSADGRILWANKSELASSGYAWGEYIGHHISEFHAEPHAAEEIMLRLERRQEVRGCELRLLRKDGSVRHVRLDSNLFLRNGRFVHTRCFLTDITEEKKAGQALFQLASIVETFGDAIISQDLDGRIISWNRSAECLFGYNAKEMIGNSIMSLIPPELQDDEIAILSRLQIDERTDRFQTTRLNKNGERLDLSLTISPVRDERGNIIGAAQILCEAHPRKQSPKSLLIGERTPVADAGISGTPASNQA